MIHKTKDLSADERAAIEGLLGRRILANEAISIRAIELQAISDERRTEILTRLEKYFEEVDAKRQPVTPQADATIDEALRSTRPQYRPTR